MKSEKRYSAVAGLTTMQSKGGLQWFCFFIMINVVQFLCSANRTIAQGNFFIYLLSLIAYLCYNTCANIPNMAYFFPITYKKRVQYCLIRIIKYLLITVIVFMLLMVILSFGAHVFFNATGFSLIQELRTVSITDVRYGLFQILIFINFIALALPLIFIRFKKQWYTHFIVASLVLLLSTFGLLFMINGKVPLGGGLTKSTFSTPVGSIILIGLTLLTIGHVTVGYFLALRKARPKNYAPLAA